MSPRINPISSRALPVRRSLRHAGDVVESPSPPNFNSAAPDSAWWLVLSGSDTWRVSTNGRGFVQALQMALSAAAGGVTYDGHRVDGTQVRVDGRWGPTTSRVLWTELRAWNANPGLLAAVSQAARARTVTFEALAAAVWYLTQSGLAGGAPAVPLAQIRLLSGTTPPPWVSLPPGNAEPVRASVTVAEVVPPAPPTPPPASPDAPGVTAPASSPETLSQDTSDDLARPSGLEPRSTANVPWGGLLAAALIAGGAWMIGESIGGHGGKRTSRRRR